MRELYWVLGVCVMLAIIWFCLCLPLTKPHVSLGKKRSLVYVLIIAVLAGLLYGYFGSMPSLRAYWKQLSEQRQAEQALEHMPSKKAVVDRLEALLKKEPKRAKGWALLGRIKMSQGKTKEAVSAYQKAWKISPSTSYAIGLGEALLLANQPLPKGLLTHCHHALGASSDIAEKSALLNLLAIHAYREKQYKEAISLWEKALPLYPVGSNDEQQLLRMIHKAQEKV